MSIFSLLPWFAGTLILALAAGLCSQWLIAGKSTQRNSAASLTPPTRRQYVACLAFFAAFALYGSLVPFEFASLDFDEAIRAFGGILHQDVVVDSRSDWLTNILLAIPLGFFGMAAFQVQRLDLPRAIWQAALVIFVCACYATGLEFAQLWLPNRTSSQNDIAAQTLGAIAGVGIWFVAGARVTHWLREFLVADWPQRRINRLLVVYCALLLFYSLLPLNLTISPADLYHKWRDGQIRLIPSFTDAFSPTNLSNNLGRALLFATVGGLAASGSNRAKNTLWRATLWGFVVSAVVEMAQLFVVGRFSKVADIVIGTLASAVGALLWNWAANPQSKSEGHPGQPRSSGRWLVLALLYAACLLIVFTAPFDWLSEPDRITKRWRNLWRIPFGYAKYWGDPLDSLEDVLFKLLLFGSLAALVGNGLMDRDNSKARRNILRPSALAACTAFAMAIEMLQVYFPPHVPDSTDVLLASAACGAGLWAAQSVCQTAKSPNRRLSGDAGLGTPA